MYVVDGKSPGQRNKCHLLKGHRLEQTKLCKSFQTKDFSAVGSNHKGNVPHVVSEVRYSFL